MVLSTAFFNFLNFSFTDEEFMNELLGEIQKGISNPLSDENFLINIMTKNDPNCEKIVGNKYNFNIREKQINRSFFTFKLMIGFISIYLIYD